MEYVTFECNDNEYFLYCDRTPTNNKNENQTNIDSNN